jgi:sugar/nucleoside kinase (ribokinase family)
LESQLGILAGLVAIGDVFVDYFTNISPASVSLEPNGELDLHAPVDSAAGGGGLQLACAAAAVGFSPVWSIATVGGANGRMDAPGQQALVSAHTSGVNALWNIDPNGRTGRSVIIFGADRQRVMISDPGANNSFSIADVSAGMVTSIQEAALLHVSGYALLSQARRLATLALMRLAKASHTAVAVDLAPHGIYHLVDIPLLLNDLKELADWLFGNLTTIRRILSLPDSDDPRRVAQALSSIVASAALFIDPGHALVRCNQSQTEWRFDYTAGVESRGQSAGAQAALLADYLL